METPHDKPNNRDVKKKYSKDELMHMRRKFVRNYIDGNSKKGVKVTHSVRTLSTKILFISEMAIYKDLRESKSYDRESKNKY